MGRAQIIASSFVAAALALIASASTADVVKIYWGGSNSTISRANVDGSDVEVILDHSPSSLQALEIDSAGGKIYWGEPDGASSRIRRANWSNGSSVETIQVFTQNPQGIVLDFEAQHLYHTNNGGNPRINRVDFDGGNPVGIVNFNVVSPLVVPFGIDLRVGTGQLYWAASLVPGIRTSDLDGSNVQLLLTTADPTFGIAIDEAGGFVYWSEVANPAIYRATLSGTGATELITGLAEGAWDIEVDPVDQKIYWILPSAGVIQRANLDGTNVETVVSVPGSTEHIALLRVPSPPLPALDRFGAIALIGVVLACGAVATRSLPKRSNAKP